MWTSASLLESHSTLLSLGSRLSCLSPPSYLTHTSVCASISKCVCICARAHVCVLTWSGGNTRDEGTRGPNQCGGHALPNNIKARFKDMSEWQQASTHTCTTGDYYLARLINYLFLTGIQRAPCHVFFTFFKFYFEQPWSEPVFLYITTITVPVATKLCGLITMALLPCDTLSMTKPSRQSAREGKESNLSVATDTKVSQPN